MSDEELTLENQLCFAVYAVGHAFNHVYKPLLDAVGLTYPQYLVMIVLWEHDGQTVGQICEKLFLESSTVTPLLKRMEVAGRLRRVRDTGDERQVRVWLTPEGAALRARVADIPPCILRASGRSAGSLRNLIAELHALRDTLDAASPGPASAVAVSSAA